MSVFYNGQLVEVLTTFHEPILIGKCGQIVQRRDYNDMVECYDVEIEDKVWYFYAKHLRPLPPFKHTFKKMKEVEVE